MDALAPGHGRAQLDAGDDLDAEALAGVPRLGDAGHGVVVSQRQDAQATQCGLLHQGGW